MNDEQTTTVELNAEDRAMLEQRAKEQREEDARVEKERVEKERVQITKLTDGVVKAVEKGKFELKREKGNLTIRTAFTDFGRVGAWISVGSTNVSLKVEMAGEASKPLFDVSVDAAKAADWNARLDKEYEKRGVQLKADVIKGIADACKAE